MTIKEKLTAALLAQGWVINTAARTQKYTEFVHKDQEFRVFVGKSGACRYGKSASDSISSEWLKKKLLGE